MAENVRVQVAGQSGPIVDLEALVGLQAKIARQYDKRIQLKLKDTTYL